MACVKQCRCPRNDCKDFNARQISKGEARSPQAVARRPPRGGVLCRQEEYRILCGVQGQARLVGEDGAAARSGELRCDDGGRIRLLHGIHLTGLSAHHQWSASAAILATSSNSGKYGIRRAITLNGAERGQ